MVGFEMLPLGTSVHVVIKKASFVCKVTGWWEDRDGSGVSVQTPAGGELYIDEKRIVRLIDTDEIPFWEVEDELV